MNIRKIALNNAAGAQVAVLATQASRKASVMEDAGANAPMGLIYQTKDDKFVGTYQVDGATEPVFIGDDVAWQGGGTGALLGLPAQGTSGDPGFQAATTLFKATSADLANATTIRFTEFD